MNRRKFLNNTISTLGAVTFVDSLTSNTYARSVSMIISERKYNDFFPRRNSKYTYKDLVTASNKFPDFCSGSNGKSELAAFFANIDHETSKLQYITEIDKSNKYCDTDFDPYRCNPNKKYYYYGRGAMQLSWNYNYYAFGEYVNEKKLYLYTNKKPIKKDHFLEHPECISTVGYLAFLSAIWYWMTPQGRLNKICHDVFNTGGFTSTINIINGGLECGNNPDNDAGKHSRIRLYRDYCKELNVIPNIGTDC